MSTYENPITVIDRGLGDLIANSVKNSSAQFSHMLQKYTDLKTWVPAHPPNDKSMWSSLKGMEYGGDHLATANTTVQTGEMAKYLSYCVDNGLVLT